MSLNALEHFAAWALLWAPKMSNYDENHTKEMMHRDLVVNIVGKTILA
ncbi:hypothetical protein ACRN9V_05855 [Shewanella baltica]